MVTSPLERCRETTRILAPGRRAISDRRLLECDYGDWTGQELKKLAKEKLWRTVQTQPSGARFPDGESLPEMSARAVAAIRDRDAAVEAESGENAVWLAVSHGDVLKAILADALGMHLDAFQRIVVDPASLSVVRYTPHRAFVHDHELHLRLPGPPGRQALPPPYAKGRRSSRRRSRPGNPLTAVTTGGRAASAATPIRRDDRRPYAVGDDRSQGRTPAGSRSVPARLGACLSSTGSTRLSASCRARWGSPVSGRSSCRLGPGNQVTSVALEKQQVQILGERVAELLDELIQSEDAQATIPAMTPVDLIDNEPLDQPIEEEFRAGTITLSWDADDERVVIEVFPVAEVEVELPVEAAEQELIDLPIEEPEPEEVLLVRMPAAMARSFAARAESVVSAGRPPCPFCGGPMDADGHLCPRANGYRRTRS